MSAVMYNGWIWMTFKFNFHSRLFWTSIIFFLFIYMNIVKENEFKIYIYIYNSSQHNSFVWTQLIDSKYSKWLNSSIWPINGTLTGTTTPG